ncbi:MAG: GNAT family N-acetyltransferase [bacterium]
MMTEFLKGPRIGLRAVEPADIDLLYLLENDTTVWKVSNTLTPFSRFQIEEYVMNTQNDIYAARQLRLMIDLLTSETGDNTIGTIDLFDFDPFHLRAGLGILIRDGFRNQGYAGEAIELIKTFSFEKLRLHQLFCNIASDNMNSLHLFEKHGFVRCGVKLEWLRVENKWTDEWMFQCIP